MEQQPEQNIATSSLTTNRPSSRWPRGAGLPGGHDVFQAQGVSCYYGSFRAVTDVSLDIYEHEITAFIGPSGCGKTTVLRTLNRMNDLVAGARVEGQVQLPRGAAVRQGSSPR